MAYYGVEDIAAFEHFNLDIDPQSSVRLVNHKFHEDTIIEHTYPPGLYISMLGKCQGQMLNSDMDQRRDYNHQYVVALVKEENVSQVRFAARSLWQSFSVMLPMSSLKQSAFITKLSESIPVAIPHIRFAELGPVPHDILRCCEAAWDCKFEGFERELFIKAKAQEILALFLHKRRNQQPNRESIRMTQLHHTLSHIRANLSQEWSQTTAARLAGSNRTYLKQDIKALVGLSFSQWLKQARLDNARQQLASAQSITQISHDVGFKNQAHFATVFKNATGMTPSEYRQSLIIQRLK